MEEEKGVVAADGERVEGERGEALDESLGTEKEEKRKRS